MEYQKEYIQGEKLLAPFRELSAIEISLLSIGDIMYLPAGSSYTAFEERALEVEEILEKLTSEPGNIEDRELIQELSQKYYSIRSRIEDDWDWEQMQERIRISPEIMEIAKQAILDDPLARLGFTLEHEPITFEQVSERQYSSSEKVVGFIAKENIYFTEDEKNVLWDLDERFSSALRIVKANPSRHLVLHMANLRRIILRLDDEHGFEGKLKPDSSYSATDPFLYLSLLGIGEGSHSYEINLNLSDISQTSFDTVERSYIGLKNYLNKMQPLKNYLFHKRDNILQNLEIVFECLNTPEKLENYLADSPERVLRSLNKPLGTYTESAVPEETPFGLLHRVGESQFGEKESHTLVRKANTIINILNTSMATIALGEEIKNEMLAAVREAKDIFGNVDALKHYLSRSWNEEDRRKRVEADKAKKALFEEAVEELRKQGRLLGPELYENLGIGLKGIDLEIPSNIDIFHLLNNKPYGGILVFDSGYSLDSLCAASQRSNGLKIKLIADKKTHCSDLIDIRKPQWKIVGMRLWDPIFRHHLAESRFEDIREQLVICLLRSFTNKEFCDLSKSIRRDSGFSFNKRRQELTCDFTNEPPPPEPSQYSAFDRRGEGSVSQNGGPNSGGSGSA